jgi:hypothetical protein
VREHSLMAQFPLLEHWYAWWQVRRAVFCLDHPVEDIRERAAETLRASSPRCWPRLRRVAYRGRSRLAINAARLLYDLGDPQGLYALLEQFADGAMYGLYQHELRRSLRAVGNEKILGVLEFSLDRLETPPIPHHCWSLSLSLYALHALKSLQAEIPIPTWRRAVQAYVPDFESLRDARIVLPVTSPNDTKYALTPPLADWRVGYTVAAVRRVAIDVLLTLKRESAFDLLKEALAHESPEVQLTAIYGLRRLRDERAYILLQPFAANTHHPLHRDAKRAIESLGAKEPDVLTLLRASQPENTPAEELLRPAASNSSEAPETLLRAVSAEPDEKKKAY